MEAISIKHDISDGHLILTLAGELTMLTKGTFNSVINENIDTLEEFRIILDVTKLKFIDSSGMGSLVSLQKKANSKNGYMHLAGVQASLLELLYIVKLEGFFQRFKSVKEALAASGIGGDDVTEEEPEATPPENG